MGIIGQQRTCVVYTPDEMKDFVKRLKRFRSFIGLTQEELGIVMGCNVLTIKNFELMGDHPRPTNWGAWRIKIERFLKAVKEQLKYEEGEPASDIKVRARELLESKNLLFVQLRNMQEEIRLNDVEIQKLECQTGVHVVDDANASTSDPVHPVKTEPLSQPPEDARASTPDPVHPVKTEPLSQTPEDARASTPDPVHPVKTEPSSQPPPEDARASTSDPVHPVKTEPSSQPPPEDARLRVHQLAVQKYQQYERLKQNLRDRARRRHFVYVVIDPITGKIVYVGESCDVVGRMHWHRDSCDSPIRGFLKQFDTVKVRIIFSGSYYACRSVEAAVMNLKDELGLNLLNVINETTTNELLMKPFAKINKSVQMHIRDIPTDPKAANHDRLLNALKFMIDRSEKYGEVIINSIATLSSPVNGALINYSNRINDGVDETGLNVDMPFDDDCISKGKSDMVVFVEKWREFREYYQFKVIEMGVISGSALTKFENPNSKMSEKSRRRHMQVLQDFMDRYQLEHAPMEKPDFLQRMIPFIEKRLEQYRKLRGYFQQKLDVQPRIIAELKFQCEIFQFIYGPDNQEHKAEGSSEESRRLADYIWFRILLKSRDLKLHRVYGARHPKNGKFVYWGECEDIEERMYTHQKDPFSSIYDFLQEFSDVEVLQIYSGPYYSCKCIETLLIALENEFDCMDLLNKGKKTKKTTPMRKRYVYADEGVFVLPVEFDLDSSDERAKLVLAITCLLEEAESSNVVITFSSGTGRSLFRKRALEVDDDDEVVIQEPPKRRLMFPSILSNQVSSNDRALPNSEILEDHDFSVF